MLEFDKKSNLLMTNRYQYSLQDVAEPNLYRELYDYESIPKVAFNMRHVPENMPDEIWMTDTTFRDGQQSVSPFTVEQIVHLYSLMHRLGGPKGLIRQSEFFLYTDKDKKALHACQDLGYDFPEITTWIRANEKDFELVKRLAFGSGEQIVKVLMASLAAGLAITGSCVAQRIHPTIAGSFLGIAWGACARPP